MVMVSKLGLMEQCMKARGKTIRLIAKVNFHMLTEIYSKANGGMINQTDMVFIYILMGQNIKPNGKMTYKMVIV